MTGKEIIKQYLIDNKFDGLFNPGNCSCSIEDLGECFESMVDCEAGVFIECGVEGGYNIGVKK